jgi:acetate kinase
VTFTGGIGENNADLREEVLSALRFLGLELDKAANAAHAQLITTSKSKIRALVLKTDEEIVVARETVRVMSGS